MVNKTRITVIQFHSLFLETTKSWNPVSWADWNKAATDVREKRIAQDLELPQSKPKSPYL